VMGFMHAVYNIRTAKKCRRRSARTKKNAPEGALQIRSRFRPFGRANDIL
jgi:hypothetical protein